MDILEYLEYGINISKSIRNGHFVSNLGSESIKNMNWEFCILQSDELKHLIF